MLLTRIICSNSGGKNLANLHFAFYIGFDGYATIKLNAKEYIHTATTFETLSTTVLGFRVRGVALISSGNYTLSANNPPPSLGE
jgi:hypothetical protein